MRAMLVVLFAMLCVGCATSEPVPIGRDRAPAPAVVAFAGDLMPGRGLGAKLDRSPYHKLWRGFEPSLNDVDVLAANLECVIADRGRPWPGKLHHFRVPTRHAATVLSSLPVPESAVRIVSLANNHALDFGVEGLVDTLDTLDRLEVVRVGAGRTRSEARTARIVETSGGVRLGFLAATDHCSCEDPRTWDAAPDRAGISYVDVSRGQWADTLAVVRALDREVDHVVFSIHWGPNYTAAPTAKMREFAAALVAAGVDVVFGHSAHHILPIERIDGKTVIYSPGGLFDDYVNRRGFRNDLGLLVKIRFAVDGSQTQELVPLRIRRIRSRYTTVLSAEDPDYAEALRAAGHEAGGLDDR